MELLERPRRNRSSRAWRAAVRETHLAPADFVCPVFVHDSDEDVPIASMPGVTRWSIDGLVAHTKELVSAGVHSVALFPKIDDANKDSRGTEGNNPSGLLPRTIDALKSAFGDGLTVIADVALDPFSSDGHDGLVIDGEIVNDPSVELLVAQALNWAAAGTDVIAPSDMMDGRVGALRTALDAAGYERVRIISYTAKYASAFYGPFRDALDSAPRSGDKRTYQMDPANRREAVREARLDSAEGADVLMVKPALAYLDVISALRAAADIPIAAYQVSGEYLMIEAAASAGWLDAEAGFLEALTAIKRAGADMIFTYAALRASRTLA